jgi:hypothetical protein
MKPWDDLLLYVSSYDRFLKKRWSPLSSCTVLFSCQLSHRLLAKGFWFLLVCGFSLALLYNPIIPRLLPISATSIWSGNATYKQLNSHLGGWFVPLLWWCSKRVESFTWDSEWMEVVMQVFHSWPLRLRSSSLNGKLCDKHTVILEPPSYT